MLTNTGRYITVAPGFMPGGPCVYKPKNGSWTVLM
jgi:hypothetical protein